jgi:hypothetical protein
LLSFIYTYSDDEALGYHPEDIAAEWTAVARFFMFAKHFAARADSLPEPRLIDKEPTKMAMIPITTSNSTNVKAFFMLRLPKND